MTIRTDKTYICDECGRLRRGNADRKNSKKIRCCFCTLRACAEVKLSDKLKDKMSSSLQEFYLKVRDCASRKHNMKMANSIAWEIIRQVATEGKNEKWSKTRGIVLETFDIKEAVDKIS